MNTLSPNPVDRNFLTPWEYVTTAEDDRRRTLHIWQSKHVDGYTAWKITHQPANGNGRDFVQPLSNGHFTSFNALLRCGGLITDYRDPEYVNYSHPLDKTVTLESVFDLASGIAGKRVSFDAAEEILRLEMMKITPPDLHVVLSFTLLESQARGFSPVLIADLRKRVERERGAN